MTPEPTPSPTSTLDIAPLLAAHDLALEHAAAGRETETLALLAASAGVPASLSAGAWSRAQAPRTVAASWAAATGMATGGGATPWYRSIRRRSDDSPPAGSGWLTAAPTGDRGMR